MRKVDKIKNIQKVNLLTEERQNNMRSLTELFGYTARKEAKAKQLALETAYSEIDKVNLIHYLVYQPGNKDSFTEKVKGVAYHLNELKNSLPTVAKYLPYMFNIEDLKIGGIINKLANGEPIESVCPAVWFPILNGGNRMIDTKENAGNKLKEILKNKLHL